MAERILSEVLEMDFDKCANTYGVGVCTAGRKDSGTAQAGAAGTITLRAGASAVNDAYKNMTVRITAGTGAGQENKVASYVGATKVATMVANWGVNPNATSVYDVIDRPNACYNAFRSCQAPGAYTKDVPKTVKFTGRGSPRSLTDPMRPYIVSVQRAATELSLIDGLAPSSNSTITLIDDTDTDVELDPYVRDRVTPAKGTYWGRLIARNLNYAGRPARLIQRYVDHGSFGAAETSRYIIDQIKGPDSSGQVTVVLKDPIKLLDRSTAPTPTSGKLISDMSLDAMQIPLGVGEGAQYLSAGWVRIGDEIIRYDGNIGDVLLIPSSSFRAQFGTDAKTAKAGDGVQQCLVYQNKPYWQVIRDLSNRAGILDADIDLSLLQTEDATWLGDAYLVTTCISDPEDISDLLTELLQQAQALYWWSPTGQKMTFRVFAPQSPTNVIAKTLDEVGYIREGSVNVTRVDDERITFSSISFGRTVATANIDEVKNYKITEIAIDVSAESSNEYNERRTTLRNSRWFTSANTLAMRTFVRRDVSRHRDAPEDIDFEVDPKDRDLVEGALCDVQTQNLIDKDGSTRKARIFITRRENTGIRLRLKGRVTSFDRRYGFIAPNGTPDYPNNAGYACVCNNTGLMTDGTNGFLVI